MKQKKINDILYVFDITPYQITEDTDAEVIKVQEECVAGFKELNESLADKIVAYNYHVACVQVPEWAPYVDEPDPTPKEDPELTWSAESATVTIGADDNVFPTLTNSHSVEVTYSSSDTEKATIDGTTGEITLVAAGDTTISAIFAGNDTYEAQTVTYALTVQESAQTEWTVTLTGTGLSAETVTIKNGGETVALAESYTVEENAWFEIYPLQDPSDYTLVSENMEYDTEQGNEHWYINPSAHGTGPFAIELNYTEPKQDPELAWSANSATIYNHDASIWWHLPTLSNPNNVTVTYSSSEESVATIDSSGEVSLTGIGNTTISAIFAGDETYSPSTVSYALTVEEGGGESGQSGESE